MTDLRSRVNLVLAESLTPRGSSALDLQPSEWEALWITARDHCLVPYLHKRWTESGVIQSLPPAIARRFSTARSDNTERNRSVLRLQDEICSVLLEGDISVLVMKGLPIAEAYYRDLGLRVLYDLDLLIRPEDRARACDLLRRIGYVPFLPSRGSEPGQPLWRPRDYAWDAERVFDPDRPVFVELHTRPWEPHWHGFGMECRLDLWQGHRFQEIEGVPLRVPTEEKLLVHLAVHYGCNVLESSARLMHLLDMVLLLRSRGTEFDWDRILWDIDDSRVAPFCFVALDLAGRAGGCSLPEPVWHRLREATPARIVSWLGLRGVHDACSMNLHNRDRSLIYFLHWNMAAGWSEKTRVLFYSLRTPWLEGSGTGRWMSLANRMVRRLRHLARASCA